MKINFTIIILFFSVLASAQTYRDTLISNIINSPIHNKEEYAEIKNAIIELKSIDKKDNPEILNRNLEKSFEYQDINYFKEIIEVLVLQYGYNVSYLSGKENYYEAIIQGDLSIWFKKMYIKNHSKWLEHNLDKLVDIQTLNTLHEKDQVTSKNIVELLNYPKLDNNLRKYIEDVSRVSMLENAQTLVNIASTIGYMPTGNSFALIQKPYDLVEWHNFQQNFTTFFDMIYPYYKSSFLNKDIPIIKFRNIDAIKFLADKTQIFGLLSVDDIPEYLRETYNVQSIELENADLTKKYREELQWQ